MPFDDPERHGSQQHEDQQLTHHIGPSRLWRPRLGDVPPAENEGEHAHRDIEHEDRLPAQAGDQRTTDDRAEGQTRPECTSPQPDRPRTRLRLGEHSGHDRQGHRVQHRATDRLDGPGRDEHLRCRRHRAEHRPGSENREADPEDASATKPVAGGAAEDEQARDDQRVRVDHPLELRRRGVEIGTDRRQRHVDRGDVEADEEHAQTADDQDDASTPGRGHGANVERRPRGRRRPGEDHAHRERDREAPGSS